MAANYTVFLKSCILVLLDDFPGIVWLMSFAEEKTKRIRLKLIPNRKKFNFKSVFG